MANAIAARNCGDDYQARWFWLQICRLFRDRSKVLLVAYEANNVKSFDDVVVYYDSGMIDEDGNPLQADYYQVKFHVTANGSITGNGMMDPAFINAQSLSILQRLKNAQETYAPSGIGARFFLYTPWQPDPNDVLAKVYSNRDGRLDWHRLMNGGPKSKNGQLRAAWREHLKINTDDELAVILSPLRIERGPTLEELKRSLNDQLWRSGLKPVEECSLIHPYDDLTRRLLTTRRLKFTREDIETLCRRENLWMGYSTPEPDAYRIGIRNFTRWAEHLEDETDAMLDLVPYFDERKIRDPQLWQSEIHPKISQFLKDNLNPGQRCHVNIQAVGSIAFATGYYLDSKAGIDTAFIQSTSNKREIWRPNPQPKAEDYPPWIFSEESCNPDSQDVALALSVTRDVLTDVRGYINEQQLPTRRIIVAKLPGGTGPQTIQNADHAKLLVDQLCSYLKTHRTIHERRGKLHIFASAPNGLLFFLGQVARSLGLSCLYEYDFESSTPAAYQPSLEFPPSVCKE